MYCYLCSAIIIYAVKIISMAVLWFHLFHYFHLFERKAHAYTHAQRDHQHLKNSARTLFGQNSFVSLSRYFEKYIHTKYWFSWSQILKANWLNNWFISSRTNTHTRVEFAFMHWSNFSLTSKLRASIKRLQAQNQKFFLCDKREKLFRQYIHCVSTIIYRLLGDL